MFSLTKPTTATIEERIKAAESLPLTHQPLMSLDPGFFPDRLPLGFAHDHLRPLLGNGESFFLAAKRAFEKWAMFDIGWVRVANPQALIAEGKIVAVEAHTLGLWTLNLSRITKTINTQGRFGFIYATTEIHVEQGEERFLLELDPETGDVWYDLEAVSRPRTPAARLGFPVTRAFQHRFARDSHRRMRKEALAESIIP